MNDIKLLFVRHGETDWNRQEKIQGSTDTDLNANGIRQAQELGKKLVSESRNIKCIYSSRQKRARVTAEIIAEQLGLTVTVLDGLEELNLGVWEGLSWTQVKAKYENEFLAFSKDRRNTRIPDGESYQMMLDRLLPALETIMAEETDENAEVLVVSHSAVIRGLLTFLSGTPFEEMMQFKIPNLSISEEDAEKVKHCIHHSRQMK